MGLYSMASKGALKRRCNEKEKEKEVISEAQ